VRPDRFDLLLTLRETNDAVESIMMAGRTRKTYYEQTNSVHSRAIQALLGRQIRTMYDPLVREDLPDQFAELLRELDKREHEDGER